MPTDLVSGGGLLSGSYKAAFSVCPHTMEGAREFQSGVSNSIHKDFTFRA